jgi:hypothetical protein
VHRIRLSAAGFKLSVQVVVFVGNETFVSMMKDVRYPPMGSSEYYDGRLLDLQSHRKVEIGPQK